jgi:hypothetical protein
MPQSTRPMLLHSSKNTFGSQSDRPKQCKKLITLTMKDELEPVAFVSFRLSTGVYRNMDE